MCKINRNEIIYEPSTRKPSDIQLLDGVSNATSTKIARIRYSCMYITFLTKRFSKRRPVALKNMSNSNYLNYIFLQLTFHSYSTLVWPYSNLVTRRIQSDSPKYEFLRWGVTWILNLKTLRWPRSIKRSRKLDNDSC